MIITINQANWDSVAMIEAIHVISAGTLDIKPIKKRLTKATLKKWAKMTDENNHREVRAQIAEFFNQPERATYFREQVVKWGDKEKTHGKYINMQVYCDITTIMLQEIKFTCGEKVYNLVNQCL